MSLEIDVQEIIYTKLVNSAALMALVNGVYDEVPVETEMPYIKIGEDVITEDDDSCTIGASASCTIHVFSSNEGRKQVKQVQGEIKSALHYKSATTAGSYTVGIQYEQSTSFLEPDGHTRHGVSTVRILIKEV